MPSCRDNTTLVVYSRKQPHQLDFFVFILLDFIYNVWYSVCTLFQQGGVEFFNCYRCTQFYFFVKVPEEVGTSKKMVLGQPIVDIKVFFSSSLCETQGNPPGYRINILNTIAQNKLLLYQQNQEQCIVFLLINLYLIAF